MEIIFLCLSYRSSIQEGWTEEDNAIFKSLWGRGPGTASCLVKGLSLLVANKNDLRAPPPQLPSSSSSEAGSPPSPSPPAKDEQPSLPPVIPVVPVYSVAGGRDLNEAGSSSVSSASTGSFRDLKMPLLCREAFQAVVRGVGPSVTNGASISHPHPLTPPHLLSPR